MRLVVGRGLGRGPLPVAREWWLGVTWVIDLAGLLK